MNKPYKLLVVDIDGTLINSRGTISDEDINALIGVAKKGVRVVLSTGRVVQASQWVIEKLKLDGFHIFFDGALVCNPHGGEEVYAEPIAPELVRETAAFARQNDLNLDFFSSTQYFIEKENWTIELRRNFFRLTDPVITGYDELSGKERLIKGTVILRSPDEKSRALALQKQFSGRLAFSWTKTPAYPDIDFINVISPSVSKGKALEKLCSVLGIVKSEVVAIGDGANDISLLKSSGLAIAMGNCGEGLKAVADAVTADVDHSGVAAAVRKYLD